LTEINGPDRATPLCGSRGFGFVLYLTEINGSDRAAPSCGSRRSGSHKIHNNNKKIDTRD